MTAIAILHPTSLLGKELRETIEARRPDWAVLRLLSSREDEIGTLTEIGGSAVYLTQVFQKVEGLPLYRYHLRLRLARALHLLADREDLTDVALSVGFSSHSHFTAAFRQAYGRSPSAFKKASG